MNENDLMVAVGALLLDASRGMLNGDEWVEELELLRDSQRGLLLDEESMQARMSLLDAVGETLEAVEA